LLNEQGERAVRRGGGKAEFCHKPRNGDNGLALQDIMQLECGGAPPAERMKPGPVLMKNLRPERICSVNLLFQQGEEFGFRDAALGHGIALRRVKMSPAS